MPFAEKLAGVSPVRRQASGHFSMIGDFAISIKSAQEPDQRLMGAFDAANSVSMCGGNDEKSWGWWMTDGLSIWHMNNRNSSGVGLATRDPSFCCRASSLGAMVGIVQGRSTVSAV